jgi:hypothetical protein
MNRFFAATILIAISLESFSPMNRFFAATILIAISLQANADGWAIGSQHSALKNYAVVEVGEVSEVQPPFNTRWNENVYQMNGRCFTLSSYSGYWGYGAKAAMLMANAQRDIRLAIFEASIGAVKVNLQSIAVIKCPAGTDVIPYSDDPEERLRLLNKRLEELKRK